MTTYLRAVESSEPVEPYEGRSPNPTRSADAAAFLRRMGASNWREYMLHAIVFGLVERRRGATGIALRRLALPRVLARAESTIVLEDVVMRGPSRISLGYRTAIEQRVVLDAKSHHAAGISIGDGAVIRTGCVIDTGYTGYVRIGARSELGPYTQLRGGGGVVLGDDVLLASNVAILSTTHAVASGTPIIRQRVEHALTTIESGCWLGANVVVLPGVTIGSGAVVGANSVVTKDLPPGAIAMGAPAHVTRERDRP